MCVGIDEAWKHRHVAEVHRAGLRVRRRAAIDGAVRAIRHDASAVGDNPAVSNGRLRDGQDPGGVIANQCWREGPEGPGEFVGLEGTTRSSLPDLLRAG